MTGLGFHSCLSLTVACLVVVACGGSSSADGIQSKVDKALLAGDAKAALIELRAYLKDHPESGRARLMLARALQQTGAWQEAETEFKRAGDRGQLANDINPALAELGLMQNRPADVVRQFENTVLSDPEAQARLLTAVAQAQAMINLAEAAKQSVDKALLLRPEHVPALALKLRLSTDSLETPKSREAALALAQRYPKEFEAQALAGEALTTTDPIAAVTAFERALVLRPHSLPVNSALVMLHLRNQSVPKARAQAARMQKTLASSPASFYLVALSAYRDQDFLAARQALQPLLATETASPQAILLAGMTELKLGQLSQADFLLSKASVALPKNADVARELAAMLVARGQADRALLAIKPFLAAQTSDPEIYVIAGQAHSTLRDFKSADAAFAQALKLRPELISARIQQALSLLARGQSDLGVQALRRLAGDANNFDAGLALVQVLLSRRDYSGALKQLDAMAAIPPSPAALDVLRAQVFESTGDRVQARASYESALAKEGRLSVARGRLAELDRADGRPDAAKRGYLEVLKHDPRSVAAMFALAHLSRTSGEDAAISTDWFNKAVAANPSDVQVWLQVVDYFRQLDDRATALTWAQRAAAALPQSPEVLTALGQAQLNTGEAQQAVRTFGQVASLRPKSALARVQTAQAYVVAKNLSAARNQLDRALELEPNSRQALWANTLLLGLEGQPENGLAVARKMQKQWPMETSGWMAEAELAQRQRNWSAAAAALRKSVALQPEGKVAVMLHAVLTVAGQQSEVLALESQWMTAHPDDLLFIGHVAVEAEQRGDLKLSEGMYKRALELRPDSPPVLNNLADLYARQKNPMALELAERAVRLAPLVPAFMDTLARAQAAAGKLEAAVLTQSRAVDLAPRAGELRLGLARLHLDRGDKEKAAKELRTLASYGPAFAFQDEVQRLLKKAGG